jgi:hypothetical protein
MYYSTISFLLTIFLSYHTYSLPGQSNAYVDLKAKDSISIKHLQGCWYLLGNPGYKVVFKKDSAYTIENRDTSFYKIIVDKKVKLKDQTIEAKNKGEFIIVYLIGNVLVRYDYLTGITKTKFSVMDGNTLQPSVFKKYNCRK